MLVSGDSDASPEGPGAATVLPSFRDPKPSEVVSSPRRMCCVTPMMV